MAVTKVIRSVHKKQRTQTRKTAPRTNRGASNYRPNRSCNPANKGTSTRSSAAHPRKVVHFTQARGKMVEDVEFSTSSDYHSISINFQDKTALNFSIETGFTLESEYSKWESGGQRVLREWPPIRSYS